MHDVFKSAIFSSSSIAEDYFYKNQSEHLVLNPIAITAEKIRPPSWMAPTNIEKMELLLLLVIE